MDETLLIARLILAAVFLVAAATKLADPAGSRRAMTAFGVPERLAGPAALALPLTELGIAIALVPTSTAPLAAGAALALLGAFTSAIVWNLARGRTPECHCFGQLHSKPVGVWTLVRNALLGGVATLVLVVGWGNPGIAVGDVDGTRAGFGLTALAIVLAVAGGVAGFTALLRQHGRLLVRIDRLESALRDAGIELVLETDPEGVPIGDEAPDFALADVRGKTVTLADTLVDAGVVLVFTSPRCAPCRELLPVLAARQRETSLVVVSAGDPDEARREAEEYGLDRVLVDEDGAVARAFDAVATPSAVRIDAAGAVASGVARGPARVEALLGRTDGARKLDEAALAEPVTTLSGDTVRLAEIVSADRDTLVLFWNPRCGYCRNLHEDIRAWERDRAPDAPELVVVSSGSAPETAAEGFRSPVVLDRGARVMSAFGANGTPMAVLLDPDLRVASPLAAGADRVVALLGGRPVGSR